METASTTIPILNYPKNILNGIVPIEFTNITQVCNFANNDEKYYYMIAYKFHFTRNEAGYENNDELKLKQFRYFSKTNQVTLRVPLLLLPYKLEFYLRILVAKIVDNTLKVTQRISSDKYMVDISSFLVEPTFVIGDKVQYQVPDATYTRSGEIADVLKNDVYKIKTDAGYRDLNGEEVIVTVHKSKLYINCVNNLFIIDITNQTQVTADLVLRTENKDKIEVHSTIQCCVYDIYVDMFREKLMDDNGWEINYLSNAMTLAIYQCLYAPEYNYKVRCPLDGNYLYCKPQWRYCIDQTILCLQNGLRSNPIQNKWNNVGYSCDLCRIEVSYYQLMYHSDTDFKRRHDFCVSCVHSIIKQYYEMKPFLYQLLQHELDDYCIDEIVIYCVGKAIKFEHRTDNNEITKQPDHAI